VRQGDGHLGQPFGIHGHLGHTAIQDTRYGTCIGTHWTTARDARPFGIHGYLRHNHSGRTVWDVYWDTLGDGHLGCTAIWDTWVFETQPFGTHGLGRVLGHTRRRPFGIHGHLGYTAIWDELVALYDEELFYFIVYLRV